ncbi:hypothetical protein CEXT_454611 [Caerostris extrusa]|uniref:Uncharacterized protein n=1 Tax=Caerostris extrusa TaxID=172846 RepID=A0AAV4N5S9_CAEEX|nr:hypothetical protein CEXT_454611 [Caerostris extrusa]
MGGAAPFPRTPQPPSLLKIPDADTRRNHEEGGSAANKEEEKSCRKIFRRKLQDPGKYTPHLKIPGPRELGGIERVGGWS